MLVCQNYLVNEHIIKDGNSKLMPIPTDNEQKLVNICFEIAMTMHDKEFRETFDNKSQEQLAEWITQQLKVFKFEIIPMGASWSHLVASP